MSAGIIVGVIFLIILLILLFLCQRIRIAIQLIKEGSKYVTSYLVTCSCDVIPCDVVM
jgi:choline transporter-like protein 2/4/5